MTHLLIRGRSRIVPFVVFAAERSEGTVDVASRGFGSTFITALLLAWVVGRVERCFWGSVKWMTEQDNALEEIRSDKCGHRCCDGSGIMTDDAADRSVSQRINQKDDITH